MKEIEDLNLPQDVKYADSHEWARHEGERIRVGISDYAQDQLGDIVFVELPEVGASFKQGDEFGTVESVKAVSELYLPLSGEITAVNGTLEDAPENVNNDPYGEGWMVELTPEEPGQMDALMVHDAYLAKLKG